MLSFKQYNRYGIIIFPKEEVSQPKRKLNWLGPYFIIGPGEARTLPDHQRGHLGWLLELFIKPLALLSGSVK